MKQKSITGCLVATAISSLVTTAWAGGETSVLLNENPVDMPGKQATVLTVDFAPGASSEPHVHPGSVFIHVLEGAVISQLEGEPATTYTKGQSWYEPPKKPHIMARNASATVPAKLLVVLISEPDEPLTVPKK
jgi:quercetin dioxygenase-like cupin family protein